jgi:hypothetical protein
MVGRIAWALALCPLPAVADDGVEVKPATLTGRVLMHVRPDPDGGQVVYVPSVRLAGRGFEWPLDCQKRGSLIECLFRFRDREVTLAGDLVTAERDVRAWLPFLGGAVIEGRARTTEFRVRSVLLDFDKPPLKDD